MFSKKPTAKEQQRQTDRDLRRTQRSLERDRGDLDRLEKQLELQIKQAAKRGDKATCGVLAKQLINLRKQRTKSFAMGSKIQSVSTQNKLMHSQVKMADTMGTTAKAMGAMNRAMNPEQVARNMKMFEQANMKMEMSEEMMNDALDDVLGESGDEEAEDAIVSQVLGEIGIDMSAKVSAAPQPSRGALEEPASGGRVTDADLERQLAALKDL